ncbi:MAG: hypothetical protein MUE40_18330 [Anaerolineae bacterium]|jgi:hypothetical protein|nr:hypothetical protein [Anaerolineae bacterium]
MSETPPLWRQIIEDTQHPLHSATWELFSAKCSVKWLDRQPAALRPQIIELCWLLLDTEELYLEAALGSGYAPPNALELLAHWQVPGIVPRLITLLEEDYDADDGVSVVSDRIMATIEAMGAEVIEPLLALAQRQPSGSLLRETIGGLLAKPGRGDERVWQYLVSLFEQSRRDEMVLSFIAENLLTCDVARAILYLEAKVKQGKYRVARERILAYLDDARAGRFP